MSAEHYPGCHPEAAEGAQEPGHEPADPEPCWHCGTPTPLGCTCWDCQESADIIPPTAIYHCPVCKRWWAWMTGLNITTITFGEQAESEQANG